MYLLSFFDLQNSLVAVNFFLLLIIFYFSIVLYKSEKAFREKNAKLQSYVDEKIEEANQEALAIITKSDYISEDIKKEVQDNFNKFLNNVKNKSEDFYTGIEKSVENVATDLIEKIKTNTVDDLKSVTKEITEKASNMEEQFNALIQTDYKKYTQRLEEEELLAYNEFEKRLRERIKQISLTVLPDFITPEYQEKFVHIVIERAKNEFFVGTAESKKDSAIETKSNIIDGSDKDVDINT
jgi:hypothetical protein